MRMRYWQHGRRCVVQERFPLVDFGGVSALFALLAAALWVLLNQGDGAARRSAAEQPPPHLSGPIDATAPTAGASEPPELLGLLKSAPPAFPPSPALPAGADLGRHCDFERIAASDLDAATSTQGSSFCAATFSCSGHLA